MKEVIKDQCGQLEKLNRVLSWLKETTDDKIIIGAQIPTDVYAWIVAAYAVHGQMVSLTGGAISMGHGVFHEKASVQKLNTKISTEAELVGASEYIAYNLWLMIFAWKGIWNNENRVYQDNQT